MGCILGERESLDLIKERCNKHGGSDALTSTSSDDHYTD